MVNPGLVASLPLQVPNVSFEYILSVGLAANPTAAIFHAVHIKKSVTQSVLHAHEL
jgi:hypothetical protein